MHSLGTKIDSVLAKSNIPHLTYDLDAIVSEFSSVASTPPGQDEYMAACYNATTYLLQNDTDVQSLINEVIHQRDISTKHFINLYYRAIQYIELYERRNREYPQKYTTTASWKKELRSILTEDRKKFKDILLRYSTTSTIYQRYIGAHAILAALYLKQELTIADFGCGGNYGLRGMDIQEPFEKFMDDTPGDFIEELIREPIRFRKGLAVDIQNPYDVEITRWRLACSFYPSELVDKLPKILALEKRLTKSKNVEFILGDLRTLPVGTSTIPLHQTDAVIMSTLCYQMPDSQKQVLETANKMLRAEGVIIIQDFAVKDKKAPHQLNFTVDWHGKPFSYRNFITGPKFNWEMYEILQWNNGRCTQVRPGEDYTLIRPANSPL